MFRWHAQPPNRVALEIELDHHGRLRPDHPSVAPRLDRDCLRSREFQSATVGLLNVDLPVREEADVRVLAELGPDDRLYLARPRNPGG